MIYIKPFITTDTLNEHERPKLSNFILDNLADLQSRLYQYDGDFKFLRSVKRQLQQKGYLTEAQWKAVYNSFYG